MNAIMNWFLIKNSKTEPRNLVQIRIFLESGLCQIYIETSTFLAASVIEIVNQILFVSQSPKNSMVTQKKC